jgi:hypothetical protein
MKMYCPFCHGGVEFDRDIEGETGPCPSCEHQIIFKHLTWWVELKYDLKQLEQFIEKCLTKSFSWAVKHWKILTGTFGILGVANICYWCPVFLASIIPIIFIIVFGLGTIWGIGWLITDMSDGLNTKLPPPLPPTKKCPMCRTEFYGNGCPRCSSVTQSQLAQGSNINQSQNHTIVFNITGDVPIVKCSHCGTPRPKQVLSCPSCGSNQTK